MILKGEHHRSKGIHPLYLLVPSLFLVVAIRFLEWPECRDATRSQMQWRCDAEQIDGADFIHDDLRFSGAHTQSSEYAYDGTYSSKVDQASLYGMTCVIEQPLPEKTYKASVWKFNPHPVTAFLTVSGPDAKVFYKSTDRIVDRGVDNWQKMELVFTIPKNQNLDLVKVYVHKDDGPNPVYFDQLVVQELSIENEMNGDFTLQHLSLTTDSKADEHLKMVRRKSTEQGLVYHDDKMLQAKLWDGQNHFDAKIRYKGDWTDHLSRHPSYRIDLSNDQSWNGMQSFSVQLPRTRGYLREWVFFKFLEQADVLTPRFDFIRWSDNHKSTKIFAYEEHFTKNLVENRNRREGPIVKLTEDRFWESMKRSLKLNNSLASGQDKENALAASDIRPFKEGKTVKNPTMVKHFEAAQNLMYQFKHNLKPAAQVFDIELMSKYMALMDICLAHHAVTWHNQRFYYNPVTTLLEPIGFDAYGHEDPDAYAGKIYAAEVYTKDVFPTEPINDMFFDPDFARLHMKYLLEYSEPLFVKRMLSELSEGIDAREVLLQQDDPKYRYDQQEIIDKANKIQKQISVFESSVRSYTDHDFLIIRNTHHFPIEVLVEDEWHIIFPSKSEKDTHHIKTKVTKRKEIQYRLLGQESLRTTKLIPWDPSLQDTPRQSLEQAGFLALEKYLNVEHDIVRLKQAKMTIAQPLIIPSHLSLVVDAGSEIAFVDQGCIISHSAISFNGTKDAPIKVKNSDGDIASITVLQAKSRSSLDHVAFIGLHTLSYDSWQLTGAVNFYESDVDVFNCRFVDNTAEDGLNIIRSDFQVTHSYFEGTYSDALDADFCNGSIFKTDFVGTGNDAIDLSGSTVMIRDCQMAQIGDKGISAGENSKVNANHIDIDGGQIAFASKDLSILTLSTISMANCKTGFAAYQKKPEFGPAKIILHSFSHDQIEQLEMIESTSQLIKK